MRLWPALPLACLFATSACQDLPPIPADRRCGNGVVEPSIGEDCDGHAGEGEACGAPGTPGACQFLCGAEARCPAEYACGLDGLCRVATGELERPFVLPLPGRQLEVADVDADGRPDLVSFGNATVGVAFGDDEGAFARGLSATTPAADARGRTADLDADGAADLLLPTAAGLVAYRGSPSRSFVPVPFPSRAEPAGAGSLRPLALRALAPYNQQVLVDFRMVGGRVTVSVPGREITAEPIDLGDDEDDFALHLGAADLTPGGHTADEVALAGQNGRRVVVVSVECPSQGACALEVAAEVALPAGVNLASEGGTWLEDIDADGAVDLFVPVVSDGEVTAAVARGDGRGGLGPLTLETTWDRALFCQSCGRQAAGLLALEDLDGDGAADLFTRGGVYLNVPGEPPGIVQVIRSQRPWRTAGAADLNRDGRVDALAVTPNRIDCYVAAGDGLFNAIQIPMSGSPNGVELADFDGDLWPDLFLVEGDGALTVRYTDRQGLPTERVQVAEAGDLETAVVYRRAGEADAVADLALYRRPDADTRQVVLLQGSSGRALLSAVPTVGHVFVGVEAGRFSGAEAPPEAIMMEIGAGATGRVIVFRRLRFEGALGAAVPEPQLLEIPEDCDMPNGIGVHTAVYDMDADGRDELVLVETDTPEGGSRIGAWRLRVLRVSDGAIACTKAPDVASPAQPGDITLGDLDGDGAVDAVIALNATPEPDGGQGEPEGGGAGQDAGLAVAWGDGQGGFDEVEILPLGQETRVVTAIVPGTGGRSARVAMMTSERLNLVSWDAAREPRAREAPAPPAPVQSLRVLDADGNGVTDLVAGTDTETYVYLQSVCSAAGAAAGQCRRAP